MKRIGSLVTALVLVLAGAAPLLAAGPTEPTTLKGWIADSYCGAKNANAEGAGCAEACVKNGAKLVLVSAGKTYQLSDQKLALEHLGREVDVTGTVENETITVTRIVAASAKPHA